MPQKKDGYQRYDWNKLKTEYVTTDISLRKLAEKHGIAKQTVFARSKEQGWVEAKKKHSARVSAKAIAKAETKQANALAKELDIADKISSVLQKALNDADQFNRYIVESTTKMDGTEIRIAEEKVFQKVDMKALKDAATALEMVERMKRSMQNILKAEQLNRERREQRKLELEEERLKMQKESMDLAKPDKEIKVVIEGYQEGWAE